MNINSSSLFYKWLVMNAEFSHSSLPNNICDLTKFVLLCAVFNIFVISAFVMFLLGNFISVYMMIFGAMKDIPDIITIALSLAIAVDCILVFYLICFCFKFFYQKIKYTKKMKKVHDIAHNKFCFDVKYTDDK